MVDDNSNPTCETLNRERIYQLSSKLSLIESSMKWIKFNFIVLADELKESTAPPIDYPSMIFQRMEQSVQGIWNGIRELQNQHNPAHPESIKCFNNINTALISILKRIIRLQNLYEQRVAGLTLFDAVEKSQSLFNEYSWISKTYNAADVLSYEFVTKSLGLSWIRTNNYVPATLFAGEDYGIDCYTLMVSMPYQDLFRLRFWPALAHEVGHAFISQRIYEFDEPAIELAMLINEYRRKLLEFFRQTYFSNQVYHNTTQDRFISMDLQRKTVSQIDELCSDIIGAFIAGPAYLFSICTALCTEIERGEGVLAINTIFSTHPLVDLRFAVAMNTLKENFESIDQDVKSYFDEFQVLLLSKNTNVTSEFSINFMAKYREIAERLAHDLVNLLHELGVSPFTKRECDTALKKFREGNFLDLNPIQLLNLAWFKRIKVIKRDTSLSQEAYFDKRKREPLMYEPIVEGLYSCYCKLPREVGGS